MPLLKYSLFISIFTPLRDQNDSRLRLKNQNQEPHVNQVPHTLLNFNETHGGLKMCWELLWEIEVIEVLGKRK